MPLFVNNIKNNFCYLVLFNIINVFRNAKRLFFAIKVAFSSTKSGIITK